MAGRKVFPFPGKTADLFLSLLRVGLWEDACSASSEKGEIGKVREFVLSQNLDFSDWRQLYLLSENQTLTGVVATGLQLSGINPEPTVSKKFVHNVLSIENVNLKMNSFISHLYGKLEKASLCSVLVKGQGIAQCYARPLSRSCGDVDLLLQSEEYQKAKQLLAPQASNVLDEDSKILHLAFEMEFDVELHGSLKFSTLRKWDRGMAAEQNEMFSGRGFRVWKCNGTDVLLPSPNHDVLFIFCHILQHYFNGGIGLRQVCDLCRLLYYYRDEIDRNILLKKLVGMGLLSEWKAFAALCVEYLGMPEDAMPFYEKSSARSKKAKLILSHIFKAGNFGVNRDLSYKNKHSLLVRRSISFTRRLKGFFSTVRIFPYDSFKILTEGTFRALMK